MDKVARVIGRNVQRLRVEKGLSQQDLADRLETVGARWSRAAVGMLESRGVRGERLSDLAALCAALGEPLEAFLKSDSPDYSLTDPAKPPAGWIKLALAGEIRSGTESVLATGPLARRVGQDGEEESRRMARAMGLPFEQLHAYIQRISGQPSPTVLRDFLASIDESTPREEARVKRAAATRELRNWIAHQPANPMAAERWLAFKQWSEERGVDVTEPAPTPQGTTGEDPRRKRSQPDGHH